MVVIRRLCQPWGLFLKPIQTVHICLMSIIGRGEAHYVLREFDKAIVAFDKVITSYPESNKVADALLKRGFQ